MTGYISRASRNLYGRARGFGQCGRCGDTWDWKPHHDTPFEYMDGWPTASCFALCEECWDTLTPKQRLPFYDELVDRWISDSGLRAGLYRSALGRNEFEDQRASIRSAVLEGK